MIDFELAKGTVYVGRDLPAYASAFNKVWDKKGRLGYSVPCRGTIFTIKHNKANARIVDTSGM